MLGMSVSKASSTSNVRYDNTSHQSQGHCGYLKKNCQYPSPYIYKWILIYLNPIVVYYNISSKIEFQGAGFKVKVSVAIYRKKPTLLWL